MDTLIEECWRIYKNFEKEDFLVKPSIPILFFGDYDKYFRSEIKVITVGLNPSKREFPSDEPFLRFPNLKDIYQELLAGKHYEEYLWALSNYFRNKPYKGWFNSFEALLNGLGCSYYNKGGNTALHTDEPALFTAPCCVCKESNWVKEIRPILLEAFKEWYHVRCKKSM